MRAARYGAARTCAGIVGHADLTLGDRVQPVLEALIASGNGRLRGIHHGAHWDDGNPAQARRRHAPRYLMLAFDFRRGPVARPARPRRDSRSCRRITWHPPVRRAPPTAPAMTISRHSGVSNTNTTQDSNVVRFFLTLHDRSPVPARNPGNV